MVSSFLSPSLQVTLIAHLRQLNDFGLVVNIIRCPFHEAGSHGNVVASTLHKWSQAHFTVKENEQKLTLAQRFTHTVIQWVPGKIMGK